MTSRSKIILLCFTGWQETLWRIEHGGILVARRRQSEWHEHDGDDGSVATTALEADITSVRLETSRLHRVTLTTLEDHVAQVLLYTEHAVKTLSPSEIIFSLYSKTTVMKFGVSAPRAWNSLPVDIRSSSNTTTFKKKLYENLPFPQLPSSM